MPHEDCTPFSVEPGQVDARSPVDTLLMDSMRKNIEFNCAQIQSGVAGKVSGAALALGAVGKILVGGQTNLGRYWKKRFSVVQPGLDIGDNFDPENTVSDNRIFTKVNEGNNAGAFQGQLLYYGTLKNLQTAESISLRMHKGENFFVVGPAFPPITGLQVFIDGQTPTSLGLTDINGLPAVDIITSATQMQPFYYMGLNEEGHEITITGNAGGGGTLSYLEVGFAEPNPTLNTNINVKAGAASVRGSEVLFDEASLQFTQTLGGHTGAVVCDSEGILTALDGASVAMTHAVSDETIQFSSGPPTSIRVKSAGLFPDQGICLYQTCYQTQALFSYSSKTTTVNNASLDGLIWHTFPNDDFTPDSNLSATNNTAVGSAMIHHWAAPSIIVTAANQNLDFEIIENGVTSQHTVAVPVGAYSGDLVSFGKAIVEGMTTINSIDGRYFCDYNSENQKWSIGAISSTVTELKFLWNTGANAGTDVSAILGFDTLADSEGATSYRGDNEIPALAARVLQAAEKFLFTNDPKIKYSAFELVDPDAAFLTQGSPTTNVQKMPLVFYNSATNFNRAIIIHPDPDACGLSVSFVGANNEFTSTVSCWIDGTESYILLTLSNRGHTNGNRENLFTGFLSFPRGSKNIVLYPETTNAFIGNTNYEVYFAGAREYFSKPAWEKLPLTSSIIETVDVSPISQYRTEYSTNPTGFYAPQASDDQINSVATIGTFGVSQFRGWPGVNRGTVTDGASVDVNFTIVGNGGGFEFKFTHFPTNSREVQLFITDQVSIVEGTDLVQTRSVKAVPVNGEYIGFNTLSIMGLPAGTYIARAKMVDSSGGGQIMAIDAFNVIDTLHPQPQAHVIDDINNDQQSLPFPLWHRKAAIQLNDKDRATSQYEISTLREGLPNTTHIYTDNDGRFTGSANVRVIEDNHGMLLAPFNVFTTDTVFGDGVWSGVAYAKTLVSHQTSFGTFAGSNSYSVDNIIEGTTLNSIVAKNTPGSQGTFVSEAGPTIDLKSQATAFQRQMIIDCTFDMVDTFLVADTTGLRPGQPILLNDGTNTEANVILSISTNVSFTVTSPRLVVVDASVTDVNFSGFHHLKVSLPTSGVLGAFVYEPLPLTFSNAINRLGPEFETEIRSEEHFTLLGLFPAPPFTTQLNYPIHSDGSVGDFLSTAISVVKIENAATFYEIEPDFTVTVNGGDISILAKSTKEVVKNLEHII